MSNVRISGLPINLPTPSSYLPVEVMTSPGVFTTSKTQLSTFTQAGPDFKHFQSSFSTATALSAGWQTAYINLCAYAPSWIGNNTLTSANSSRWSSAYNTVTAYFPYWQAGYNFSTGNGASVVSTVSSNSASWGGGASVYTTVNTYSAAWQTASTGGGVSVYQTVNPLSAAWTSATKTVTALSSHWEGVFTNVYPNSGNWQSTYTLVNTTTATTFLVNSLSARGNIATTGNITTTGGITATGNITTTGSITARSEITALLDNNISQFRAIDRNNTYGLLIRNDGINTYFLFTAVNDPYGTWNALRPFYINNSSGNVSMANGLMSVAYSTGAVTLSSVTFSDGSTQYSAGVGSPVQSWQNVTSTRTQGSTYTNSTGRPIQVAIYGTQAGNSSVIFYINNVQVSNSVSVANQASQWLITSHIIPHGATYRLGTGQQGINWWELR